MTSPIKPSVNGRSDEAEAGRTARDNDQTLADSDQTASDADQTAADSDQTTADEDQRRSSLDQDSADADQRSADLDQQTADREERAAASASADSPARRHDRKVARDQRAATSAARALRTNQRHDVALERLSAAEMRDAVAHARDAASQARDLAAAARDRSTEPDEPEPRDPARRHAAEYRERAAEDRRHAAEYRERAAEDRRHAAEDREQARIDREELRDALAEAQLDDLTGTYQRAMGRVALQAEIDRVQRSHGRLVIAIVDVDSLKAHNDRDGHAAGDKLLLDVVTSIRSQLRSYDPIVRFGGDEFVCALADADLSYARKRFSDIQTTLEQTHPGASISTGFAQLDTGDTLEGLIARADAALQQAKPQRR
jgi:diguanylate cyclase (GGDEF)-like protein